MDNRNTRIRYCDICRLWRTAGSVECYHFVILMCESVGELFRIIREAFLRLQHASCLLFHRSPVSFNRSQQLPDLLRDLNIGKMDKHRIEPDVISHTPRRYAIQGTRRERPEDTVAVHSVEDHMSDSLKIENPNNFFQRQNRNSNHHCCNLIHERDSFRCSQNDRPNGRNNFSCDYRSTRSDVYDNSTLSDNSSLLGIDNASLFVIPVNQNPGAHDNISDELVNSQRFRSNFTVFSNHRGIHTCRLTHHRLGSSSQLSLNDAQTSECNIQHCQENTQRRHYSQEFNYEIAKNIIRALRTIGDELDARHYQQL